MLTRTFANQGDMGCTPQYVIWESRQKLHREKELHISRMGKFVVVPGVSDLRLIQTS